MFAILLSKKKAGVYCFAHSCKNDPVKKKGGLCHKHYRRKLRELDPVYCRFNGMKGKAKSRNISFTITLKEFRFFCKKTRYLSKGIRGQNATVDRRCNIHGYHLWNIQLLTNRQNARKGNRFRGDKFENPNKPEKTLEEIINSNQNNEEDLPF